MRRGIWMLGIATLGVGVWRPTYLLYRDFFQGLPDLSSKYGSGSYALITGASDGIGKAFADQLASQGFNLVLIGRNEKKLEYISQKIKAEFGVDVDIIVQDLQDAADPATYQSIYQRVENYDLSILVNNVGAYTKKDITELNHQEINHMVFLNTLSMVHLSNELFEKLSTRHTKSAIINVSSIVGRYAFGGASVYSATKAFNYNFSQSLAQELKGKIDVMTLCPGKTLTQMHPGAKKTWSCVSADDCVNSALKDLGRRTLSYGASSHEILGWLMGIVPESLRLSVLYTFYRKP